MHNCRNTSKNCFYLQIDIISWNQRKINVRSPEYIPDCVSRSLCWSFCLFSSSCSSHTCLFCAALFDLSAFCILNSMCLKITTAKSEPTPCVLYSTCLFNGTLFIRKSHLKCVVCILNSMCLKFPSAPSKTTSGTQQCNRAHVTCTMQLLLRQLELDYKGRFEFWCCVYVMQYIKNTNISDLSLKKACISRYLRYCLF